MWNLQVGKRKHSRSFHLIDSSLSTLWSTLEGWLLSSMLAGFGEPLENWRNQKQYPEVVTVRWMSYILMTIFVSPSPCPRVNQKSRCTRTQRIFFFSLISTPKGVVDSGETCFSCAPGFSYWFSLWLWAVSSQFSHQCNYWEAPHPTHDTPSNMNLCQRLSKT